LLAEGVEEHPAPGFARIPSHPESADPPCCGHGNGNPRDAHKTMIPVAACQVDCTAPKQATKYSKWRGKFRKTMEKKGLEKTKATEIMVSLA